MIVRMLRALAFVVVAAVAVDARAQTFTAPAALGADREEAARQVTLPSLSAMRPAAQVTATRDRAQPDTSAAELMVAATTPAADVDAGHASWLSAALGRAVRTARRHPRAFEEQLDLAAAYPDVPLPENNIGEAIQVAAVVNDRALFEEFLNAANPDDRPQLERRKQELLAEVAAAQADDRVSARVFADGTIRGTAEGKKAAEGVGTGSLAVALQRGRQLWYAAITVASTEDTLSENFGPALLAPGSGKALSSGLLSVVYMDRFGQGWDLHPYISTSRHLWSVNDTARTATVLGLGLLLRRGVGTQQVGGKDVSLALEIGPTARFLGGDVLDLSESARDEGIGTSNTAFFGVESGATLSVGDLVGSVQLYYLPGQDEDRVLGLSNLQLVAGFSVKGELFRP